MGCTNSTPAGAAAPTFDEKPHSITFTNHESGSPPPSAPAEPSISFAANLGMYGTCKFKGKEAAKYLSKVGAKVDMEDFTWTSDPAKADKVAAAVLEWAKDHGETAETLV